MNKVMVFFLLFPSIAFSQITVSEKSPLEFRFLFNKISQTETENLRADLNNLSQLSEKVSSITLKRVLKQIIYSECLKPSTKSIDVKKALSDLKISKSSPLFIQWLRKSIEQDYENLKKLQTTNQRRAKEVQLNKYLTNLVKAIENSPEELLRNLRQKVLEQALGQLNLLQGVKLENSLPLIQFKNPPPTRQESLNKLLEGL